MNARDETNASDAGFTAEHGALPGATRDRQSITRDWTPLQKLIDGVVVREVRNVPKDNGYLFDARRDSATTGRVNVFRCGDVRPQLVVVPPGVWHGVQNIGATPALLLNLPDRGYAYESPDHWRLPPDTAEIPYSFAAGPRSNADDPGRY